MSPGAFELVGMLVSLAVIVGLLYAFIRFATRGKRR